MKIVEIFDSIDGEGCFAGAPATFIRLAGCNIRCSYCDTSYALKLNDGKDMAIHDIIKRVDDFKNRHITLTGGEPLIHKDIETLILALCMRNYIVNIETNGSIDISKFQNKNTVITIDYKTISSGMNSYVLKENYKYLRESDVLKIVCNKLDFDDIRKFLENNYIPCLIYFSPIFGEIEPHELVDFIKSLKSDGFDVSNMRIQVQLHKIIWNEELRGV